MCRCCGDSGSHSHLFEGREDSDQRHKVQQEGRRHFDHSAHEYNKKLCIKYQNKSECIK